MRRPSGDRVASAIRLVCSKSATFTGAALACAVETTLFGSVGTRSAGPEAKERMLDVESRSKTAEERIIRPRKRGKHRVREYDLGYPTVQHRGTADVRLSLKLYGPCPVNSGRGPVSAKLFRM